MNSYKMVGLRAAGLWNDQSESSGDHSGAVWNDPSEICRTVE
jgi:hypothetical protein